MADDQNVYDYVRERTARGLGEPVPPPPEEPLNRGGGGGTFDGMDDARLASVESRLTNIESEQRMHFRWSIGTTLALAISLAGLIFTSSAFLMSRVDRVEDRLTRLETNINELPGKLTGSLNQLNQTLLQAIMASKQNPPQVIVLPPNSAPEAPAK